MKREGTIEINMNISTHPTYMEVGDCWRYCWIVERRNIISKCPRYVSSVSVSENKHQIECKND